MELSLIFSFGFAHNVFYRGNSSPLEIGYLHWSWNHLYGYTLKTPWPFQWVGYWTFLSWRLHLVCFLRSFTANEYAVSRPEFFRIHCVEDSAVSLPCCRQGDKEHCCANYDASQLRRPRPWGVTFNGTVRCPSFAASFALRNPTGVTLVGGALRNCRIRLLAMPGEVW